MPHTDLATSFSGQYFVVTGSTQGLGAAVAHTLARRGAAGLIICGRRRTEGDAQVRQLAQLDCQAFLSRPTWKRSKTAALSSKQRASISAPCTAW